MNLILSSTFLIFCGVIGACIGDRLEVTAPAYYADMALVGPVFIAVGAGIVVLGFIPIRRPILTR